MSEDVPVDTPQGPGRWLVDAPERPDAVLVLGHGAGGGLESRDLTTLARRLPAEGVAVARFAQPWLVAGRKVAVRPPQLDEAWLAAVPALRRRWPEAPLVTGGRSAGARVACRTATEVGAGAVLCLAFPLHLPGRTTSRLEELLAPAVPRVVLQGARDPFGGTDELRTALAGAGPDADVTVLDVPDAGHDLRPAQRAGISPDDWRELLLGAARRALAAAAG
ncbi:hydrolase [Desertihabitans brevis]|uniref:Hydrolase n=1 Tax=Desertihabitans brevis TaxID=2268447 RepID=A0A367YYM5_9ACTN|nr:alpha/beta family hydrolase [Desertihabitans brevis]RCK71015.1 hydrolase [Desertihabitans brevis]